ncbi:unnamed protein product [Bursaphelenchus okinawaensis]|uniref:CRAL-TRIO domain-containing protein n=1 Tax=Bursaphelenchus okinawaensis TaxID=465554 RepID=A0A811KS78_9BILA|nr:unnamed protein product [Bursaphelenchus okinawaensis]CAG9110691.1 unnamed protein product [Bursaphelenchus okinawaensis]
MVMTVLSQDDNKLVLDLRQALGVVPEFYDDDYCLMRWIEGWDNNHDQIIPRIREAAAIISTFPSTDHIDFNSIDDVELNLRRFNKTIEYHTGGLIGLDKNGDLISCVLLGRFHTKSLLKCSRVSEITRNAIWAAILGYTYMKNQEKIQKKKLGFTVIMDLEGYNRDHLFTPGIKVYTNFLSIVQNLFPETTKRVFVTNAPTLFQTAFTFVKPVLSQKTKEKIKILGSDYHSDLFEAVGQENLPTLFGGTKQYVNGHPEYGHLRMGGIMPEDFKYSHLKNPLHMPDEKLTKLVVPARSQREITVNCTKLHQHLQWFFLSNGDITFSIKLGNKLIWPEIKTLTEFVPEYETIECRDVGEYVMVFDNTFSTFFSKEIRYFAQIN